MTLIPQTRLWIGSRHDSSDWAAIHDREITAIVDLALDEKPIMPPREVVYLRFPISDGASNDRGVLRLVVDSVANLLRAQRTVLICCSAGLSRSPAVAACAIASIQQIPCLEALEQITVVHRADVSPGLWADLLSCTQRVEK